VSYWKYREGSQESKSLDGVTTGVGTPKSFQDYQRAHWLVVATGTVAGGTVIIESAHDPAYAGVWNQLASVTPVTNAAVGGSADFPPGSFIRARIGVNITGGATVVCFLNAQREP